MEWLDFFNSFATSGYENHSGICSLPLSNIFPNWVPDIVFYSPHCQSMILMVYNYYLLGYTP